MHDNKTFEGMDLYLRAVSPTGDTFEEYRRGGVDGVLHNDSGPAVRLTLRNGVVSEEMYYRNGQLHRAHLPAVIVRRPDDGTVCDEKYYYNGQIHREDGPALISRDPTGLISGKRFLRYGIELAKAPQDDDRTHAR